MQEILRLALLAAQALALVSPPEPAPRTRSVCVIAGAASIVICLLLASGFLLAALWLFLVPLIGQMNTALVIAGLLLVKASALALWIYLVRRPRAAPTPTTKMPTALLGQAEALFAAHKSETLLATLLAGILAGGRKL